MNGFVYITCADCGAMGPAATSSMRARYAVKAHGWSRCYRGSGEAFRCPGCRAGDRPVGAPADLIARALLFTAGAEAGGTDTESFTDDEREQMVDAARSLIGRAVRMTKGATS